MDLSLQGKSVLVTAASKGLGRACALEFAREGATVTIASRDYSQLQQTALEIEQETGQKVHVAQLDVTSPDDIHRVVETVVDVGGGLHVLVTNAGGPPAGSFLNFEDETWNQAVQLNLLSVVRLIRESIPHMKAAGGGRIVNLASSSVRQPIENLILSNTLRAGVHGLSKSLALELARDGILVNTVAPGRIATDRIAELDEKRAQLTGQTVEQVRAASLAQIPLGRYGNPDEFGKAVAFLGSFTNSYITGQALLVDGGMVKAL
jgi:3-oxoacyl-[acyl-carrier protein] reductase